MEEAMQFRERVIDTMQNPELNKRRVKPLTEHFDFYTLAGTYKRGLRHLEKENTVIEGELEPLIR